MSAFPCPACGARTTAVTDSRWDGASKRRRRHCPVCRGSFTTYEATTIANGNLAASGSRGITELLSAELARLGESGRALARRTGVGERDVHRWLRRTRRPLLPNIEAALNALGMEIAAVRRNPYGR